MNVTKSIIVQAAQRVVPGITEDDLQAQPAVGGRVVVACHADIPLAPIGQVTTQIYDIGVAVLVVVCDRRSRGEA